MASIPKRVEERLIAGVKKFQSVLALAKSNDVNESDTVVILNDLLADGYDRHRMYPRRLRRSEAFDEGSTTLSGKNNTNTLFYAKTKKHINVET